MALCDICKKREANITHTKIINGKSELRHLCEVCAREARIGSEVSGMGLDSGWSDFNRFFDNFFGTSSSRKPHKNILSYLSESSNEVLEAAKEEALSFNHDYIGTEHLLIGITNRPSLATEILEDIGISTKTLPDKIRTKMNKDQAKEITELTLTPRAKRAFEVAFEVARSQGAQYISPEHILIGIVAEKEGIAARVLREEGATLDKIERDLQKYLGRGTSKAKQTSTPNLDRFSRDLTSLASEAKLDPVIGRNEEIDRIIRILSRRTKNNPVLIGEPGVGKTAIVEGIAQRIADGQVPDILANKRVIQLDLSGVVAGTKYRGEFEERMKQIIDEIKENSEELIIFIDELHTVVGAGAAEGAIDAGNMLKPSLARGELHVIGATTLDEYRKHVEKDAALERRFQPVLISEPTIEEAINILRGLRDRYEAHHRVRITDDAVVSAVNLSDKYISDRFLPDKAIDLIDEAASKVRLSSTVKPPNLRSIKEKINKLDSEKENAVKEQNYEKAAELRDKLKKEKEEYKSLEKEWREGKGNQYGQVTGEDIAEIVSEATGIPVKKLVEEEIEKYLRMEKALHKRIVGQNEAVDAVSEAVRRTMAGLKDPNRPMGSFMFLGPTGVGKTELARALADFLFGDEDAMVRLDMSEYMEKHTVSRLVGSPPGYVGHEEGGQLTEAVRRKPYSVILLDEIEKAHPDVFNILLQILDDGRLTDARGRTVDFKNTLVVMTSNIGSHFIREYAEKDKKESYSEMKEKVLDTVKKYFRPEFLNRIDDIVVFHSLTREHLIAIVELLLERLRRKLHGQGLGLEVTDKAKEQLVKEGYDPQYGARPLKRIIQKRLENEISKLILEGDFKEKDIILVDFKDNDFTFSKKEVVSKDNKHKTSSKSSG